MDGVEGAVDGVDHELDGIEHQMDGGEQENLVGIDHENGVLAKNAYGVAVLASS